MTTDYKNLTFFEAAAVILIVVGVGIIGFQIFVSLPESTQVSLASAIQVFDIKDATVHAWQTDVAVSSAVFTGVKQFQERFYLAAAELMRPVTDGIRQGIDDASVAYNSFTEGFVRLSDSLASNYQGNHVRSGVETSAGGKIMGAYIEQLSQ
jgi:hypothetical protein